MKFSVNYIFFSLLLIVVGSINAGAQIPGITSPDKKLSVMLQTDTDGKLFYSVAYSGNTVLQPSRLGLVRSDADFSTGLKYVSASKTGTVKDAYTMVYAKRRDCRYTAQKKVYQFRSAGGEVFELIFQVSNDGVAFRYHFPNQLGGNKTITSENTAFFLPASAKGFLQPMQVAKSGWEQSNPAYEEAYKQNIAVGTPSPSGAGWVYPALFQTPSAWVLITEADLGTTYCASHLQSNGTDGNYALQFPDKREAIKGGGTVPQSDKPFYSPWRIITVGTLKTIAESTLGTDLAKPNVLANVSFVKPGKSSWSWIMSKDNFIVYDEQKKYIDFAADMRWQYCLVDADWDQKIGYDKIKELSDYAAGKGVGLLLWYNSAGDWNTVKYTPKDKMLTHESRTAEFTRLKEMGIKGIKVDFFGGDGQSVINYYQEILEDAAAYGLMVNFHGATLPRGWARTYPNLVTTEAIKGFEMVTFNQADADAEANHCAMLPFTRNAFDPMDFTPMNLYKIGSRVQRKTTSAFELALSVLFLSGIQHYAESPEGMTHVPDYVKDFLRQLPDSWDDVRFLQGDPGKLVVLGRKAGNRWYIAGINGENNEKNLVLDLTSFGKKSGMFIGDGAEKLSFEKEDWDTKNGAKKSITLKPNGGFVLVLE